MTKKWKQNCDGSYGKTLAVSQGVVRGEEVSMNVELVLPDEVSNAIKDLTPFVSSRYGIEPERVYLRTEHFPYEALQSYEVTREDGAVLIFHERKLDESTISAVIAVGLIWIETDEIGAKEE